ILLCSQLRMVPDHKETNISRTEGESVTLKCSYETSSQYVRLFWYRQYPNRALQYLLYKEARQWSGSHTSDNRFQSTTSRSSTEFTIREVRLADTALYYCALRVGSQ
uniref:Ig-like domain-containing protein n=1 Tax=Astyanax mexicanus TaxID=7994 RepID=W5K9Z0_ASTMX